VPNLDELRENFDYFDSDDNGRIDRAEFKRLMGVLGADAPEDELDIGFDAVDTDDDGAIDFNEFAGWWMNR
jgi:calmodulin